MKTSSAMFFAKKLVYQAQNLQQRLAARTGPRSKRLAWRAQERLMRRAAFYGLILGVHTRNMQAAQQSAGMAA
jgi:hypothetical protein